MPLKDFFYYTVLESFPAVPRVFKAAHKQTISNKSLPAQSTTQASLVKHQKNNGVNIPCMVKMYILNLRKIKLVFEDETLAA